jgi:glucans biosynthesis protein
MVDALAKSLSLAPFAAPKSGLPKNLAALDFDRYRDIRFRTSEGIWARDGRPFQLQFFHRGFLFVDPVEVAVVEGGVAKHVVYRPEMFFTGKVMTDPLPTSDIGFSGIRILSHINQPKAFDEALVFQGASYFRSLGRGQVYGLSARGLAIKTGDPTGEEFPAFRAIWVETPAHTSDALTVHALLDSPSTAGAYHFKLHPSLPTVIDVQAVLFPRHPLDKAGLAPETSMFMFSGNGRTTADDFRPEVHDSDALLMVNGKGEHLLRPLANPADLQVSSFVDHNPQGFGLLQRNRDVHDYQDFESHYERRPSVWVEPVGEWGDGSVDLIEIPSDSEIHDNIVAYWHPKAAIPASEAHHFAYRLLWGEEPSVSSGWALVLASRRGRGDVRSPTPLRLFVVDYSNGYRGKRHSKEMPHATVTATAGQVRDVVVADNPLTEGYRVSFVLDPKDAKLSELRLELGFKDGRRAETWVYRWTGR